MNQTASDEAVPAEMQSVKEEQLYSASAHDNKQHECSRIAHVQPSPSRQHENHQVHQIKWFYFILQRENDCVRVAYVFFGYVV